MHKSVIAALTVLILMTMTLSSTLEGMHVEEESVRSLAEENGGCTSDGDCTSGQYCDENGECADDITQDDSTYWRLGGTGDFAISISGITINEETAAGERVTYANLPMDSTNRWYVMNNSATVPTSFVGSIDLLIDFSGENLIESKEYDLIYWLWSIDENGDMFRHTNYQELEIDLVTGQTSFFTNFSITMIDLPYDQDQVPRSNGCYWVEYWVMEGAPQIPGFILPGGKTDMVSFGLPCPTDDTGDSGNETNDGGDEPQYGNCSNILRLLGDSPLQDGLHVCDEETGEWVLVTTRHPHGIVLRDEKDRFAGYLSPQDFREIGCDEEPTEGQLNETNLADLLNEHDEILVVKGNDTFYMAAGPTMISLLDLRDEFAIEHPPSVLLVYEKEDDKFQGSIYLYNFHRAYGDQGFRVSFMTMIEDNGQGSYSGIAGVLTEPEFLKLNAGGSRHTWAFLVETDENGTVTNVNFIKRDVESCPSDNIVGSFEWDRDSDDIGENFDENETEDESSGILVAAGGVEVTTRDAAVAGVGLLIGIGGSVITRWLRPKVERQGSMSTAADTGLDDYIEETGEIKGEPLIKEIGLQDAYD